MTAVKIAESSGLTPVCRDNRWISAAVAAMVMLVLSPLSSAAQALHNEKLSNDVGNMKNNNVRKK